MSTKYCSYVSHPKPPVAPCVPWLFSPWCQKTLANTVSQSGLFHAIQQSSVDRLRIGRIRGMSLVRLDQRASHRAVDDADGNLLAFHQVLGEVHAPVPDLQCAVSADRVAPTRADIPTHGTETADPLACVRMLAFSPIRCHRIGLAVDQVGIPADQIGDRMRARSPRGRSWCQTQPCT